MTPQQYRQEIAYHEKNKTQAIEGIANAKLSYIKASAPYPLGTVLKVNDRGKTSTVKVKSYVINEDLSLEPVYCTLEGKEVFLSRPVVIK
jgi:hypothetical protein